MVLLRVLGAGLVIIASTLVFTFAYAGTALYFHNRGALHPTKAIGLGILFTSPLYWALTVALIGGIVWLFVPHAHVGR
jgi:hypothetical protein